MKIAFLIGSDLTSHLIVNDLLPELLARGHEVLLNYTANRPNSQAPAALRRLYTIERALLAEHVYPHVTPDPSRSNSPAGIAQLYAPQVTVRQVANVNAPAFVAFLAAHQVGLTVSVRCYQKFGRPLIEVLRSHGVFANLHPGFLPAYRGVLTFSRALAAGDRDAGFTLHHVDERWDAGPIIAIGGRPLDHAASVLENMCRQRAVAATLVLAAVDDLAAGNALESVPQEEDQARYFTHPTAAELAEMGNRGVELFRVRPIVDLIAREFGEHLRTRLIDVLDRELEHAR
ncbi:formyltransferase family protein [Kutzneria buriramensis]|uniref:Formyl transferase-like protein n=1 Tax=Kutzneria buriramensis TaxID=1045776 RepID=A0A3E0G5Q2_9PSEU|nr:formyltransferase family protein [Kutzneria buriramensis]REH18159.1 formyl transferase-like protein [Kutzneria buriramensis]